ncbi:MAG: chromosome segregation protein SMC [Gammaproteobacteria bacterium]|nr:chromosome segregation protein SMC [Gammaproteobacteria bacterium]
MRLNKIKLAGFKSFVDPTAVEFPSALVGVAGPNGSGKSNIIDAVRWVMGESSAKQLRGGRIADVIFNGSGGRQPLASAVVDMVFDNSDGRLGGEYAGWREIAIRRSVDREGVSNYFLNGTRCRRRDIADVFLGTGLGPRSYAIIEQGTISRLVESRPEELREFLEEAAGISRYKERRRETENRMRHTRENLERVDDVLEEVDKRLAHLRRQARAAERYREYKSEERRLRAELLALRIRVLDADFGDSEKNARERGLEVEREVTREREIERDLAAARGEHDEALAATNRIQQRYFDLQTEIARLEENMAGARREHELHSERLGAISARLAEIERQAKSDEESEAALQREVERLQPALEKAETQAAGAGELRDEAERIAAEKREHESQVREKLSEAQRRLAVAESGMEAAAERQHNLARRGERMHEERRGLEEKSCALTGATARAQATRLRAQVAEAEQGVSVAEGKVETARAALRQAAEELGDQRRALASVDGRLDSLRTLAQASHGGEEANRWLKAHRLDRADPLAAALNIEEGWENAVEFVLGDWLESLEIDSAADGLAIAMNELQAGSLGFVERGAMTDASPGTLAKRVLAPFPVLNALLNKVRTCDSLDEMLRQREQLLADESLIMRDGLWCGRHWLRMLRAKDTERGVLEREREQRRLEAQREQLVRAIEQSGSRLRAAEQTLQSVEAHHAETRNAARESRDRLAEGLTREAEANSRETGARERMEALAAEIDDLAEQVAAAREEGDRRHSDAREAEKACRQLEAECAPLDESLAQAGRQAFEAREHFETLHREREALALRLESTRVQARAAATTTKRLHAEREALAVERGRLQGRLADMDDPAEAMQKQLNVSLDKHRRVNEELAAARDSASVVEARVNELERRRHAVSNQVAELREGLEAARLTAQQLKTRREGIVEQLEELDVDLEAVLAALEEGAEPEEWERRLESTTQRIQRLGAINLTAIEECTAEAEREDYLKKQRGDLAEAMETLQAAIKQIDRETRERFKETFERVNQRLDELFQRLFGGGSGKLVLTGEELLDAGVVITARPPGKKNATIQMLSGGEKALVAVALVFAIFELNPAPFCLLDEVDAPMDDANVDRFCDLVKDMSANTQFVLITHNRRTMAVCHQLIGVTMQEPGVSRLVGVDVDEAERLAVS